MTSIKVKIDSAYLRENVKIHKIGKHLYLSFEDFGIEINFKNKEINIYEYNE